MSFEVGKVYNGFKLLEERQIKEVNSLGRVFYHEKSGARLLSLQNDDDNKVFSIGFRTPPKDSTGVAHILEHSVLCGSRKFPTKEPFVELAKGSLNTFLNAMTYPDKTMYPVASRNEKDFRNLMDVYMDAVFYPNLYKTPEIMMQEGWHYEINKEDEEITYKGVVYNEMKGAFSSPESILFRSIGETLFPDTTYGVESGGNPESIPDLTQEQFTEFHKEHYHPANSYIYLYGNMDIVDNLKFINEEYLNNFDKIDVHTEINIQNPTGKFKESDVLYPISSEEDEKDKTYLSLNFVVGNITDPEIYLAFDILENILLETPASPLKRALIEAGIGKDVFGYFNSSILQPVFSVVVKNANESEKDKFKNLVLDTLEKLSNEGLDKKLIESAINLREFSLREADYRGYPKGLVYCIMAMDSWLYDKSPFTQLQYEETLSKIKTALNTNYFEDFIKKYFLDSNHSSLLMVKPKKGLAEERTANLKEKLKKFKESLSDKEIKDLIKLSNDLKERQSKPDTPEQLETIPLLSLSDVNPKTGLIDSKVNKENEITVLHQPAFTGGICYVNAYFDTSAVPQELIQYETLLSGVLGNIGTEKYSYEDLSKEVNIYTGGIDYSTDAYSRIDDVDRYATKFTVKGKALVDKLPKMLELYGEILIGTKFEDKKRIKEIIQEIKSRLEMGILQSGHVIAALRVSSYFSNTGRFQELTTGISLYKFIADLEKNFDAKSDEIIENLNKISKIIFNKSSVLISVTCEEKHYNDFKSNINILVDRLYNEKFDAVPYKFELSAENEGLITPSNVQYVAKGYNFRKLGHNYTGSLQVLKSIIGYTYLWNRVRVQGGAYGSFANFKRNGNLNFASYRDPNLKETLAAYDGASDFVENFDADEREMTKYILGTISNLDTPLTPSMKGERAVVEYLSGVTEEFIQNERTQVLNTKVENIREAANLISECVKENYFCVLGNEQKIRENEDVFGKLTNVFS
ncbi:MAG: insulinase family protein [Bacillota bacterium]|nr:insulinase family protein [Bacillota bacterium]